MKRLSTSGWVLCLLLVCGALCVAQDAADLEDKKRQRLKDTAADFWIYDDMAQGDAEAKASGKPLLVSFRCVP